MTYEEKLSLMIQEKTVSDYNETDLSKYDKFQELLEKLFPNIFAACEVEKLDHHLMMVWKGTDGAPDSSTDARKKGASQNPSDLASATTASVPNALPILFMNHHDVVEANGAWTHEPFSGEIVDGKIWGRGTLDTKGGLFSMLQAADELASEGYKPSRDIYFVSTRSEETDGSGGALITNELEKRGVRFEMVLDEGGMIMYDPIGGADGTFAMVGLGEKAYATIKFIARSNGGHGSTPTMNSPLVRLGKFIAEADRYNNFNAEINPAIKSMFKIMAPYIKGPLRFVMKHNGLFSMALKKLMPKFSATANALLRTTLAFTMAKGSDGNNVIPQEAYVLGDMRASHHQGIDESLKVLEKIAGKYDIEIEVVDRSVESSVTDPDSRAFDLIKKSVDENFDNVITCPYIMTGASDCRFFTKLSDNCFRFVPFIISEEQMHSIHGNDECVDISCLEPAVGFYKSLMKMADKEL